MSFRSRYSTSSEVLLILNKEGKLSSFRVIFLPILCHLSCIPEFFKICSLASQVSFRCFFPLQVLTTKTEMVVGVQESVMWSRM